jgi:hypothetical protein
MGVIFLPLFEKRSLANGLVFAQATTRALENVRAAKLRRATKC